MSTAQAEKLYEVALRIKEMREIAGISEAEMAVLLTYSLPPIFEK